MPQETTITNLEKACDLLLILSQEEEPLPVAEISRRLDVSRTTAYAMLASLQNRGFVERNAEGRFTTGFALLRVADGYQRNYPFLPKADPYLQELARQWKQSVMLAVYKSPCYLLKLLSAPEPHLAAWGHQTALMNALQCAAGQLLMAALPPETLRADLERGPSALLLPPWQGDVEQQERKLSALRGAPCVIERGDHLPSRGSIAAPVYNRQGHIIAAITSSFFLADFDAATERRMTQELSTAALRISAELGYPIAI